MKQKTLRFCENEKGKMVVMAAQSKLLVSVEGTTELQQ